MKSRCKEEIRDKVRDDLFSGGGGRKSITLLEGSQAKPARLSGMNN
jgi:hypothetical protein